MERQPPHTDAMLLLPLDSVMVDSTRICAGQADQIITRLRLSLVLSLLLCGPLAI
jgi:hypothetical protein